MTDALPSQTEGAVAVIYLRVSSKEQAERGGEAEGYSIPAQREACRRKAESLGAAVVEEFVDRGESAKTADRPELQRMLTYITENPVAYSIVHKVDRLARSRADDVQINLALKAAGVELVSVSENIDQTPSGLLLHGIMSSIAEFYSRNLAAEVLKGSVQKARNGGTPGRAPLGYLNVRHIENGRELRTVEIDPERAPLIAWAFEAYATGNWTVRKLVAELNDRGLTTLTTAARPSKPLSDSQLHNILRHPYYTGVVRYRGAIYPGKHDPLVDIQTWQRVQELLTAKNLAGEIHREHPHYLKGSIHCGHCGSRLIVSYAKGRGGTYPYFICIGRQRDRHSCTQRALRIALVEEAVAGHYATVQLPINEITPLRSFLKGELENLKTNAHREQKTQRRRLDKLERERKKLLDAHYADAIPLDLLRTEQTRITAEVAAAEGRLTAVTADYQTAEINLQRAITLAGDCHAAYQQASDTVRRQFNQAFFKRIYIDENYNVTGELDEPFATLLGDDLRRAAVADHEQDLREAVENALKDRDEQAQAHHEHRAKAGRRELVAATPTPTTSRGQGWSADQMVGDAGLEPATSALSRRRSPS